MLVTRRQALASAICAPLLGTPPARRGLEIISEDTLLARESAAGYSRPHELDFRRHVLVIAGFCNPAQRTLDYAERQLRRGSLVILECGLGFSPPEEVRLQAARVSRHFGLYLHGRHTSAERYIQYSWPHSAALRSFGPVLGLNGAAAESLANSGTTPVAVRKQYGSGELLYLGAMLGPGLFAGEREAQQLWRTLLVRCAGRSCAGTSTTA